MIQFDCLAPRNVGQDHPYDRALAAGTTGTVEAKHIYGEKLAVHVYELFLLTKSFRGLEKFLHELPEFVKMR
jgi:hypothetical protein